MRPLSFAACAVIVVSLTFSAGRAPSGATVERTPRPRHAIAFFTDFGERNFYVGADNGLFSFAAWKTGPVEVRHITNRKLFRPGRVSRSFYGRDIFGPAAAHLVADTRFEEVGPLVEGSVCLPVKEAWLDAPAGKPGDS